MNWISICGTVAALCSVISFVPQAWRIVKSRDTSSISPATYNLTVTGFALWTAYGVGLWQWPLILTNSICLVLSAFILFMTLLPQSKKEADRASGGLAPWAQRRALEFMRTHLLEDNSLDTLAAEARLSPFHLVRMFKKSLGVPPRVYLTRLRLERASELSERC